MGDELEQEIVYEFDTCISKESYFKPLYGKISRKHIVLHNILLVLITAEVIALAILEKSNVRFLWIIVLIFIFLVCVLGRILKRFGAQKLYEKIHAAGEDRFSYTFYNDCVKVKNSIVEVTLKYDTAEFFAENDKRLMIIFPFNRAIDIEKSQCDEEMLAFFKKIVPEENQKKVEKKTARKFFVISSLLVLYTIFLAAIIAMIVNINSRAYYPEYLETTYISFEACLDEGTITDVVIINNKFVEYTFTGYGEDERYYTVYPDDDIEQLTEKLDRLGVSWEFE